MLSIGALSSLHGLLGKDLGRMLCEGRPDSLCAGLACLHQLTPIARYLSHPTSVYLHSALMLLARECTLFRHYSNRERALAAMQ